MKYGVDFNNPEDLPDVLPLELVKAACEWGDAQGIKPQGDAFIQAGGKCACLAGMVGMYLEVPWEDGGDASIIEEEHRGDLLEAIGRRFFEEDVIFDWFDAFAVVHAENWAEVYDLYCQELDEMGA